MSLRIKDLVVAVLGHGLKEVAPASPRMSSRPHNKMSFVHLHLDILVETNLIDERFG